MSQETIEQIVAACGEPEKTSLYDEDGVEGWVWTHPDGRTWTEIGSWSDPAPAHPLLDDGMVRLTPDQQAAISKRLSDPNEVARLNSAAKARYDQRNGIDPDSSTEFEDFGIKRK